MVNLLLKFDKIFAKIAPLNQGAFSKIAPLGQGVVKVKIVKF